jgi:hypothetical protein
LTRSGAPQIPPQHEPCASHHQRHSRGLSHPGARRRHGARPISSRPPTRPGPCPSLCILRQGGAPRARPDWRPAALPSTGACRCHCRAPTAPSSRPASSPRTTRWCVGPPGPPCEHVRFRICASCPGSAAVAGRQSPLSRPRARRLRQRGSCARPRGWALSFSRGPSRGLKSRDINVMKSSTLEMEGYTPIVKVPGDGPSAGLT